MIVFTIAALAAAGVSTFFWRREKATTSKFQDLYADKAYELDRLTATEVHVFVRKIGYRQYEVSDDAGGTVGKGKTPRTAYKAWVDGRGDDYEFYTTRRLIHGLLHTAGK